MKRALTYGSVLLLWAFLTQSGVSQTILYNDFSDATALSVTRDAFFVLDKGRHRFVVLSEEGEVMQTIGGLGFRQGAFNSPTDIDATNGLKIYVADYGNNRIQLFDKRGQVLSVINSDNSGLKSRQFKPKYLVVTQFGELIVFEESTHQLLYYDLSGNLITRVRVPDEINRIDGLKISDNRLFVLDRTQSLVIELSLNGLYVTFYAKPELKAFEFDGTDMMLFSDPDPTLNGKSLPDDPVELVWKKSSGWLVLDKKALRTY
ncbi:MAG: hypothetical protein AAFW89_02990 [Bacteroidota bacterium]